MEVILITMDKNNPTDEEVETSKDLLEKEKPVHYGPKNKTGRKPY